MLRNIDLLMNSFLSIELIVRNIASSLRNNMFILLREDISELDKDTIEWFKKLDNEIPKTKSYLIGLEQNIKNKQINMDDDFIQVLRIIGSVIKTTNSEYNIWKTLIGYQSKEFIKRSVFRYCQFFQNKFGL